MFKILQSIPIPLVLLAGTTLEVSGDAIVRMGIYQHAGTIRIVLFVAGAALLFGYGALLNTAPVEFGRIVGLYIATLFVVWQIINFLVFRALPALPVWVGGSLVVAGGLIITFWRSSPE
jgi:small multidrug resistance family-3 protein